ncbi:MAG: ABC transporter [Dictyoglomus sp. NZ13-RE01]|nr:MAG: ABC transporter [Dictyoglomus sp. NZ13-RE01]
MRKFLNLIRKEIRELITPQLIFSLLFTIALFYFMGSLVKTETKKAISFRDIYVLDLDKSKLSEDILNNLSFANFKIHLLKEKDRESAISYAKENKIDFLLIIPEGFASGISKFQLKEIETYSFIRSLSLSSSVSSSIVNEVISAINRYLSDNFIKEKFPDIDPDNLKNPIKTKEFVIVKDKVAEGSAGAVSSFVYSQSVFIPIILMMVIMYSSQMVLSAIAMEKQDKTLETLLTVPISRSQIVVAKMIGAGLVGLISAGIYMFGFRFYMGGFMGDISVSDQIKGVAQKLGLQFTTEGYVLLGISLFLAILCALALSTILGVLAEDLKSAQSASLPLTFLVIIPYFLSLFSDINSLSLPLKILVWIIPFSHPFIASQNVLLGNYSIVYYGIIYMLVVFAILILIASKIFSTDRILTMKLRFKGKKSTVGGV